MLDFLSPRIIALVLILISVMFEVGGDIFFKLFSVDNKYSFFFIGLGIYIIGGIFWAVSLKYDFISRAASIFTLLNLLILVAVGVMFFNEQLNLANKIGVMLGVLAVILLEI